MVLNKKETKGQDKMLGKENRLLHIKMVLYFSRCSWVVLFEISITYTVQHNHFSREFDL